MAQEWKKIGAKRTKFLDLGVPMFGPPRRILVQPASAAAAYSNQENQTLADSSQTKLENQDS